MKKYEVTLFILGLPYSEYNTRTVEIEANSQDEAERKAHDCYVGHNTSGEVTAMRLKFI